MKRMLAVAQLECARGARAASRLSSAYAQTELQSASDTFTLACNNHLHQYSQLLCGVTSCLVNDLQVKRFTAHKGRTDFSDVQ
jgi:hypothetical protein